MAGKKKASTKSKNPASKRDYKKEYARDQKKRIKYRAALNKENREDFAAGRGRKGDGLDQAHVKDVRNGGAASSKTVLQRARKNRGWRKGKKGYD